MNEIDVWPRYHCVQYCWYVQVRNFRLIGLLYKHWKHYLKTVFIWKTLIFFSCYSNLNLKLKGFLCLTLLTYIVLPSTTGDLPHAESDSQTVPCTWSGDDALRRADFCANKRLADMFRNVCTCGNPAPITFKPRHQPLLSHIQHTPLLVMAANRPTYLYRALHSVLNAFGVQKVTSN